MTDKENAFCEEYLIDFNATQAAIRAGYSAKTACEIGSQNLRKLHISKKIDELKKNRSERTKITQEQVLKAIMDDCEMAREIKQYSVAMKGNELLGKHLAMFTEKVEQQGKIKIEWDDPSEKEI